MSDVSMLSTQKSHTTGSLMASLVAGPALGLVVVLIGAVVWGVIAYFTDTVYFIIPLAVGFAVASALLLPFKHKPILLAALLFVLCVVLTMMSALLGDYVYYTLVYARDAATSLPESATMIAQHFVEIATDSPDTVKSVGLAAIGALLGFINAMRR
jgi:hypothetical protein